MFLRKSNHLVSLATRRRYDFDPKDKASRRAAEQQLAREDDAFRQAEATHQGEHPAR